MLATKETTLITSPPQNAAQKPSTTKPIPNKLASQEAIHKVKLLITSMNSPRVRTINPQESIVRIGLSKTFTRHRIKAITPTAKSPSLLGAMVMPGTRITAATTPARVIK